MNKKKLDKLRRRINDLRQSGEVKEVVLIELATALGRYRFDRGKEPTYISNILPQSRPITIPSHKVVKKGTARNILDALEADIDALEDHLPDE